MTKVTGLLATTAMLAIGAPAAAATVTFESLAGRAAFNTSAVLTEAGYTLTYAPAAGGFFVVGSPPNCTPACVTNGTNAFYSYNFSSYNSDTLTITSTDGGLFSLSSFAAATTFTTINRALSLSVTGVGAGGPVNAVFFRAGGAADTFTAFSPTGFTNLSSLTFAAAPGATSPEFALDNIVLNAAAVPEPASWAMMILGMGAVGFALRRRGKVALRVSYVDRGMTTRR